MNYHQYLVKTTKLRFSAKKKLGVVYKEVAGVINEESNLRYMSPATDVTIGLGGWYRKTLP